MTVVTTCSTVSEPWVGRNGNTTVRVVQERHPARVRARDIWRLERQMMVAQIHASVPDVVHAHWTYEHAWAAQDSGHPTAVTIRDAPGAILMHYRNAYRAIRWGMAVRVARNGGQLIANSPYVARAFRRQTLCRSPIEVIPNALTDSCLLDLEPPTADQLRAVLVIGDSSWRKNVAAALRMQRVLEAEGGGTTLTVIGPGLDDSFLRRIRRSERPERVRMLGAQSQESVRRELSACGIVLHPALEESFGNVLLEAMAASRPIVAGRAAGAVPFVVGPVGELVDVRRPAEMARAVAGLIAASARATRLGAAGRDRVVGEFSGQRNVKAHLDLYESLRERTPSVDSYSARTYE